MSRTATWTETLEGGQYGARRLPLDTVLRITDVEGDACVQLLLFNANRTGERFNPADTMKVPWQAYLGRGSLLLSDMGRVLATVVDDTSERHDGLCGGSNRAVNDARHGDGSIGGGTPNARDLLALGGAKVGLGRADIGPCLNLFKTVRVAEDGALTLEGGVRPGCYVDLRMEMDVVVLLANTPHRLDDRSLYTVTPVQLTTRAAERSSPDPLRESSPERQRLFENTDALLAELGRAAAGDGA
jgi:uncharacterized protein